MPLKNRLSHILQETHFHLIYNPFLEKQLLSQQRDLLLKLHRSKFGMRS